MYQTLQSMQKEDETAELAVKRAHRPCWRRCCSCTRWRGRRSGRRPPGRGLQNTAACSALLGQEQQKTGDRLFVRRCGPLSKRHAISHMAGQRETSSAAAKRSHCKAKLEQNPANPGSSRHAHLSAPSKADTADIELCRHGACLA